eukprot:PhM_4_TR18450/c1_g1_i1/m.17669
MGNAAGAFKRLPQYTQDALPSIQLSVDQQWKDAQRAVKHFASLESPPTRPTMSKDGAQATISRLDHDVAMQMFLCLMWACAHLGKYNLDHDPYGGLGSNMLETHKNYITKLDHIPHTFLFFVSYMTISSSSEHGRAMLAATVQFLFRVITQGESMRGSRRKRSGWVTDVVTSRATPRRVSPSPSAHCLSGRIGHHDAVRRKIMRTRTHKDFAIGMSKFWLFGVVASNVGIWNCVPQ